VGRLHCDTCTCGDEPTHGRAWVNTRAPFYGLVVEIDRLSLAEQRAAWRRARDRHLTEGTPDV
jgi:hypothetical protein